MKKSEFKALKADVVRAVREMAYGDYARTSTIAHKLKPDAELDTEELFELEEAVLELDRTNEMVIDKLDHFNKVEGLPYNLGFYKLKNKGIADGGCNEINFCLLEGNFNNVIEGIIDFRTGRIVIDDMKKQLSNIFEISEKDRCTLSELFLIKDFSEESREMKAKEIALSDGIGWEVSIYDRNYETRTIHGAVEDINDIPMAGARELMKSVDELINSEEFK